MANLDQIISQIRFQLDQLSARNAHHDFEHLCRHLTRSKICSNILPATGPVSSGGDQGRDFETFRTYLNTNFVNSAFIGLASDKTIVFACSVQKENINSKIKSDIKKIMSQGSEIDEIIYFCTSNLPVAKRHELQDWARDEYSIELDVHDGNSISELLSDRDVFWIADKYLNIPSEMYPRSEEEDDWYAESFDSWKSGREITNYADYFEVKEFSRHAALNKELKQDLPFWISILEKILDEEHSDDLKLRTIYDISFASLKGIGTLIGQENRIKEYFSHIPQLEKIDQLEDASALLNYCLAAEKQGLLAIDHQELVNWHEDLINKVDDKLTTDNIGLKCSLLELRGYLNISPLISLDMDLDDTIDKWIELAEIAGNAPLFPLERFSNRLTFFTKILGKHPKYDELTQKVDLLLSERTGDFNAAEKCRDRAKQFIEMRETLKAIDQLHKAKVKWFADETLYGSLLAILSIATSYLELGLTFAAKYYALAAAYIAIQAYDQNVKKLIPRALFVAASCDFIQGSWCGYLEMLPKALLSHLNYSKDPNDLNKHHEFANSLNITGFLIFTAQDFFGSDLEELTEKMLDKCPSFKEEAEKYAMDARSNFPNNIDDIWPKFEQELYGRPFGDLNPERRVIWSELGITWKVSWKNNYTLNLISEQFIAILQIILADLTKKDLCLLKTDVKVSISVNNSIKEPMIDYFPSNEGRKWDITFPTYESIKDIDEIQIHFIAIVNQILNEVSLIPQDKFNLVIEECFKEGISVKAFVGNSYIELYRYFVDEETFNDSDRASKSIPESQRTFKLFSHEELRWLNGPGPGYDKDEAKKVIKKRYEYVRAPIKFTLERLLNNSDFILTVKQLKDEGWLDWQILSAVATAAINYRVNQNIKNSKYKSSIDPAIQHQIEFRKIMNEEEKTDSDPIPFSTFTKEKLIKCHNLNLISTVRGLGLECKQETPDFGAISHFLGERYNYWSDDINHEDIFELDKKESS